MNYENVEAITALNTGDQVRATSTAIVEYWSSKYIGQIGKVMATYPFENKVSVRFKSGAQFTYWYDEVEVVTAKLF